LRCYFHQRVPANVLDVPPVRECEVLGCSKCAKERAPVCRDHAVSKIDRLSRSLLDFASIMQRAQRAGWTLPALDSPADLTMPYGEAMAGVLAVFGQLERRLISQRTSDALKAKQVAGVVLLERARSRCIVERDRYALERRRHTDRARRQMGATTVRKVVLSRAA
jgi:DNA invertase Pin-like site-specific DNA recombinase